MSTRCDVLFGSLVLDFFNRDRLWTCVFIVLFSSSLMVLFSSGHVRERLGHSRPDAAFSVMRCHRPTSIRLSHCRALRYSSCHCCAPVLRHSRRHLAARLRAVCLAVQCLFMSLYYPHKPLCQSSIFTIRAGRSNHSMQRTAGSLVVESLWSFHGVGLFAPSLMSSLGIMASGVFERPNTSPQGALCYRRRHTPAP